MRRRKLGGSAFAGLEMMCSNGGIELALTSITFRRTLADWHAMEIAVEHLSIAVREGLEGIVARDSHRRVAQVPLRKMSEDGRLQDPILRLERVCPAAVQGEDITLLIGQRSASMHMAREDAHDKRSHISLRRGRNEVLMRRVDESAQTRDVYHRCRGASCVIRHSSRGRWDRRAICSRCRSLHTTVEDRSSIMNEVVRLNEEGRQRMLLGTERSRAVNVQAMRRGQRP